jgi:hypothetical protein
MEKTSKPLCQQGLPCACSPDWVACPCEDGNPPANYDISLTTLRFLEESANRGRGVQAVRDIITYLERGEREKALTTISSEWDKIESHGALAKFFIDNKLFTPVTF